MVFYMNLYRICDFLCEGCVRFFKNIKNKEMAGIKDIEKVR